MNKKALYILVKKFGHPIYIGDNIRKMNLRTALENLPDDVKESKRGIIGDYSVDVIFKRKGI